MDLSSRFTLWVLHILFFTLAFGACSNRPLSPHSANQTNPTEPTSPAGALKANPELGVLEIKIDANGQSPYLNSSLGSSPVIHWTAQGSSFCQLFENGLPIQAVPASGIFNAPPLTTSAIYTLRCENSGGKRAEDSVIVHAATADNSVDAQLTINGLVYKANITSGATATLAWQSRNATSCSLRSVGGDVLSTALSHSNYVIGPLLQDVTYILTCQGAGGTSTDAVQISVGATTPTETALSLNLTVNGLDAPPAVPYGSSVILQWQSSNASSCVVSAKGDVPLAQMTQNVLGISSGPLTKDTEFILLCFQNNFMMQDRVSVRLLPSGTAALTASGSSGVISISMGGTATLKWSTTNAASCELLRASNNLRLSTALQEVAGISTGALFADDSFSLKCTTTAAS